MLLQKEKHIVEKIISLFDSISNLFSTEKEELNRMDFSNLEKNLNEKNILLDKIKECQNLLEVSELQLKQEIKVDPNQISRFSDMRKALHETYMANKQASEIAMRVNEKIIKRIFDLAKKKQKQINCYKKNGEQSSLSNLDLSLIYDKQNI